MDSVIFIGVIWLILLIGIPISYWIEKQRHAEAYHRGTAIALALVIAAIIIFLIP